MDKIMGMYIILGICGLVLVIGLMKKHMEVVLNFLLRVVLGVVAISFTNQFLIQQGFGMSVGLNPVSIMTVGLLGVGGYGLLYGILAYELL